MSSNIVVFNFAFMTQNLPVPDPKFKRYTSCHLNVFGGS